MHNLLTWDPEVNFDSWYQWTPMPSLSPLFSVEKKSKKNCLSLSGNGNHHVFGAWCQYVEIQAGGTYQLEVRFQCQNISDLSLHITPHIVWRREETVEDNCSEDTVYDFRSFEKGTRLVVAKNTFTAPNDCDGAEIRLLMRYAKQGQVWFDNVSLMVSDPLPSRMVTVGAMRYRPYHPASQSDHIRLYAEKVDQLAHCDIILLPEFANTASAPQKRGQSLWELAEKIPGPFCKMLSHKASTHNSYICSGLLEQDGDYIFNSAILYNHQGELIGKQRKVHPYWPEGPQGISPGDQFDVFTTDFGVVGIMICYDSWWPESARVLGLKGAELILFPNAGYEEKILPARAIDNNVFLVASTLNSPATIINSVGETLANSSVNNVLSATIDLNNRPKCHPNAGGNLNSGPGGARWARNARSNRLYEQILNIVREPLV